MSSTPKNEAKKPLILLQNPWSPRYAGSRWPRPSWLVALQRSQTGRRLEYLIQGKWDDFHFDNTTEIVAPNPWTVMPADAEHLAGIVEGRPWVIACGLFALKAVLPVWEGPLCAMPHPAYRLLTNGLLDEVRTFIEDPQGRRRIHQRRGTVEWEDLSPKVEQV